MQTQKHFIDEAAVWQFHRDGYFFVEDLFSQAEVDAMLKAVEGGDRVASSTSSRQVDSSGKKAKLAIWFEIGNDVWGAASICPRVVTNVRILLNEEAAFFHGKVMLKEAKSGGAWEWH